RLIRARRPAAAVLGQGGQAVGAERLAPGARRDRVQGEELAVHDLLGLEAKGAAVARAVHHAVDDGLLVRPAEREERLRLERDAQLGPGVAAHPRGSSKRPPTAASSSGVLTLVRLAAAPHTRRSSASLT